MLTKDELLAAFRTAVAARDPEKVVREFMPRIQGSPSNWPKRKFGIAVGKAAMAMARGFGPVERGVVISPAGGELPAGWRFLPGAEPFPDERSVAAARVARAVIAETAVGDRLNAFVSGGASAMLEDPIEGVSIEEFARITRLVMESGAPITELDAVRSALSRVKNGRLIEDCAAPVATFVASDVVGDPYRVIGGAPTIWMDSDEADRIALARTVLSRVDASLANTLGPRLERVERDLRARLEANFKRDLALEEKGLPTPRGRDSVRVILPMNGFVEAIVASIGTDEIGNKPAMMRDPWEDTAQLLAKHCIQLTVRDGNVARFVAWGEPTLNVPEKHGEGGRMQQVALLIAKGIAGKDIIAMAIDSDGVDGPPPANRPAPAGAIVDGTTWDAIAKADIDGEKAIRNRDAGTALAAVDALVVSGPTGINHGDVVVIGPLRGGASLARRDPLAKAKAAIARVEAKTAKAKPSAKAKAKPSAKAKKRRSRPAREKRGA
jgi:glycerate-2-kinase